MADVDEEMEAPGEARDVTLAECETDTRTETDSETETETDTGALAIHALIHLDNCARSYKWTTAALETGVERIADGVWLHEILCERVSIGIIHSTYNLRRSNPVRTAIRKGSDHEVNERTHSSRCANDNVIASEIGTTVDKME